MVKNSKWRPTLNMASNRHFFTTKSTITPSIWTCSNFFLMQFNSFGHQTFFKYNFFKLEIKYGGSIQNGGQNVKKLVLAAKLLIFNGFSKIFLRLICLTNVHLLWLSLNF
jgi:hypothetical protein